MPERHEHTGGAGIGPAGSMPAGSHFELYEPPAILPVPLELEFDDKLQTLKFDLSSR